MLYSAVFLHPLGRGLALGGVPLFDHDADERARLCQVLPHEAAVREEPVHQGPQGPGHEGELHRGHEGDDGVVLGDAQPGLVAAELVAEEDARGEARDEVEDRVFGGD